MNPETPHAPKTPWLWVPSVYVMQSLPFAVVTALSVILFTTGGLETRWIGLWTSLLALPWVLKPFCAPLLESVQKVRRVIVAFQAAMGILFLLCAAVLSLEQWPWALLALFLAVGILSALHDALVDGFYIRALVEKQQSFFSGIRSTFFRIGMLLGVGGAAFACGKLERFGFSTQAAWQGVFVLLGGLCLLLAAYHAGVFATLHPPARTRADIEKTSASYATVVIAFFQKKQLWAMLGFVLLYRFAEGMLTKLSPIFMLKERGQGGLGLSVEHYGLLGGTFGVLALITGGIFGGWLVSRVGLKKCFWPMAFMLNVPDLLYVGLAWWQPQHLATIGACVVVEQFGYGFGFTAFMVYLLYAARGAYPTAHYAILTGVMALSLLIPGALSGYVVEYLGFFQAFVLVCALTSLSFLAVKIAPLEGDFGRRET